MTGGPRRMVSVIVPCRNERRYIEVFCNGVCAQVLPSDTRLQLIIADGMSDDGTRELLARLATEDARIAWIDNPQRIVSTGLNRALSRAEGQVIVRMDVHTEYPPDYIAQCLAALRQSGADNVGGPWHAEPDADALPMQGAVAAAFQSRWVAGGASSRSLDYSGWVDTVYLGCWPRATFTRFGDFDESLVRNQDDEHNLRIVLGGGCVWQSASIQSVYRPRAALSQVFQQYFQYGYWKPFVMKKHGQAAAWRQVVPGMFVAALLVCAMLSLVHVAIWPLGTLLTMYGTAVLFMTVAVVVVRNRLNFGWRAALRVPVAIATCHLSYGLGSLFGAWDVVFHGHGRFTKLTR